MIARRVCLAVVLACCGTLTGVALAARSPTARELRGIARVTHVPSRCLYVRVSTVDRRFAKFAFRTPPSPSCVPYVANGETVVHYTGRRWHTLLAFSSDIHCPVAGLPAAVARDLHVCP